MLLVPVASASAADGLKMNARALMQGHVRAGLVVRDRGRPRERRSHRHRRAADLGWRRLADAVRHAGRAGDGVAQGIRAVRPAAHVRRQHDGRARQRHAGRRRSRRSRSRSTTRASSSSGLVAENPARLVGQLDLLPNQNGLAPVIVPLAVGDLPERVQAWAPLDRLIWQDVDAASLTPAQLAALRTWIAGGGRLVIVGGTGGADVLSAFPDDLLPYRPTALLDVDPAVLAAAARRAARRRDAASRPSPATRAPAARSRRRAIA